MVEQAAAVATKELITDLIGLGLSMTDKLKLDHCYIRRDQSIRRSWKRENSGDGDMDFYDDADEDEWGQTTIDSYVRNY